MTSFNAGGSVLPLEEYWKKCVNPKPLIPPSYPGTSGNSHHQAGHRPAVYTQDDPRQAVHHQEDSQAVHRRLGHRQAGHLRTYKDLQESDDDEDEQAVVNESVKNSPDGCAESDFNSNVSQINYEMDDFNKTYCDESSPWQGESSNSQQWRLNVNRSQPNAGQRSNVKSRLDLSYKNRWQKKNWNRKQNWNRKNNGNTSQHNQPGGNQNRGQQQARFTSMEQRMRYAYNSFSANLEQSSSNVPMNHKYNLQTIPQNPLGYSSSITSMIDSVSNLSNNCYNRSYVRCESSVSSLNDGYAAGGAQVTNLPKAGTPIEVDDSASDDCTVQQVARHVMLMMSAALNNDSQPTPEFFKNKKAMDGAAEECHVMNPPQGFK